MRRLKIDWEAARVDANILLRTFVEELEARDEARTGLLRRWPERPNQEESIFVPEFDVRQAEHNPFTLLRNLIKDSLFALLKAPSKEVHSTPSETSHGEIVSNACTMSDKRIAEALPLLLPKLRPKALLSISPHLWPPQKGSASPNRAYLVKRVELGFLEGPFEAESIRGTLKARTIASAKVLKILKSANSYKSEAEMSKGRISLLGPKRSPKAAAIEALMQLENLPLMTLHVVLEVLRERTPDPMIGKLPTGSNKNRLSNSIVDIGMGLLSRMEDDDPLPETLRKALVVISVSARHESGDDGRLIEFLSPHPHKIRTRQRRLIYSLSRLKLLSNENVAMLFQELAKSPKLLVGRQKPDALRKILLDCLLRSEVRRIPNVVRRTLKEMKKLVRRDPKTKAKGKKQLQAEEKPFRKEETFEFQEVRLGVELEATLRLSVHLQQMVRDSLPETPEPARKLRKSSKRLNRKKTRWAVSEEERIVKACDRTAGLGYTLVGCAIEVMLRLTTTDMNSIHSVTNYLRSGAGTEQKSKAFETAARHLLPEHDQVTFILNSAESLLGASVMSRVKNRLGKV